MSRSDCRKIGCVGFEQGQIVGFPPTRLGNGSNLRFQITAQFGERFAQGPGLLENVKRFNGQIVILADCGGGAGNRFADPSSKCLNIWITAAKKMG